MIPSSRRTQPDSALCTGRPAACRRIGLHVVKPRARGKVAVEGSRSTRVSAMRTSWRAVGSRLQCGTERWSDMTRRTTMRGTPLELRYLH
jgi:hypothetical protein